MPEISRCSRFPFILLLLLVCLFNTKDAAVAQTFSVLHTFQYFPRGAEPYAPVNRDPQGNIYGTTYGGGPYNAGVVFKLDSAGNETVLHTFTGGVDGGNPYAGIVADSNGNLYGVTYQGGTAGAGVNKRGAGVVFKIDTTGHFTVLYAFTGGTDGGNPYAGVILDPAGNLYGTTYYGGASGYGVVYRLSPANQETILYSFTGGLDGGNPYAGLTLDSTGNLYGTTYGGGGHAVGVVYTVSAAGQETVLYSFGGPLTAAGSHPYAGVVLDSAGNIYGAAANVAYKLDTSGKFATLYQFFDSGVLSGFARDAAGNMYITLNPGGSWPNGAVFKLNTSGKISLLCKFSGSVVGAFGPNAGPILDSSGNLYGATSFQGTAGIIYEIEASGTVKTLYNFQPSHGGMWPYSGLTANPYGGFYGTTSWGGGPQDAGVVFKLSDAGEETVLYAFKGGSTDGSGPQTEVVLDRAGNLYGTTAAGGAYKQGVVYKLSPLGQETILHNFTGGADGALPVGITLDSAGNLYGTTFSGGKGSQNGVQDGVVFKLDAAGKFSVLYSFTGLSDGGNPEAGVVLDKAGNLYGTTSNDGLGAGVVFKISTGGVYSVLHTFSASTDGGAPYGGLTLSPAGYLYGTCTGYGPKGGGTVFKLDALGNFSVVYAFSGGSTVGNPMAGVVLDATGNLYGTISIAGDLGACPGTPGSCGIVYKIDTSGNETVLYSFTGGADGNDPIAPLTLDGAGHLYGLVSGLWATPVQGGAAFKITLP